VTEIDSNSDFKYVDLNTPEENCIYNSGKSEWAPYTIGSECKKAMLEMYKWVLTKEAYFNAQDAQVGDGDMGTGMALSAKELLSVNTDKVDTKEYIDQYLFEMGDNMSRVCGGSSGPFYGSFIMGISSVFKAARLGGKDFQPARLLFEGIVQGKLNIQDLGRAKFTDRTMLYVLHKVTEDMRSSYEKGGLDILTPKEFFTAAAVSADTGRIQVRQILPTKGRSQYLGDRVLGMEDPGCEFVFEWCNFLAKNL